MSDHRIYFFHAEGHRLGDALVRVAYEKDSLQWDVVFQYSQKEVKYVAERRLFEYALLLEGFVLEREQDRFESRYCYLKALCPYHRLASEAETRQFRLNLKVLLILFSLLHLMSTKAYFLYHSVLPISRVSRNFNTDKKTNKLLF